MYKEDLYYAGNEFWILEANDKKRPKIEWAAVAVTRTRPPGFSLDFVLTVFGAEETSLLMAWLLLVGGEL